MKNKGITLIETMVAMALLAAMTVLGGQALFLSRKNWEAMDKKSEAIGRELAVQGLLMRLLESAEPMWWGAPKGFVFLGDARGFSWYSFVGVQEGGKGLFRYEVLFDEEKKALVLRRYPGIVQEGEPLFSETLMPAARARFSYFGASDPGGERLWRDEWRSEGSLPLLVRLQSQGASDMIFSLALAS